MAGKRGAKLNRLFRAWSRGTVATQTWLDTVGVSSKLANWHVRSGWLERFGPRAFSQPGDKVDWRGGVYALQSQLGMTAHPGGQTALEMLGHAHYLPLGKRRRVLLISDRPEQLPAWFRSRSWEVALEHHCLSLFTSVPEGSFTQLDCGGFEITISSTERAMMEELRLVRTNDDVRHALLLMQGLMTLRPTVVQLLLESCTSVKVKRLFLWSAERAGHPWVDLLSRERVALGAGKRQIFKGGQLDTRYRITVPRGEDVPGV